MNEVWVWRTRGIMRETFEVLWEKSVPVPLSAPAIPHNRPETGTETVRIQSQVNQNGVSGVQNSAGTGVLVILAFPHSAQSYALIFSSSTVDAT